MITYISYFPGRDDEGRVGLRPRQGGDGLEDRTQAAQQNIGSVVIGWQSQFADEFSQPKYGLRRPMLVEVENELSCQQHEGEDATHPLEGVDADIFDI